MYRSLDALKKSSRNKETRINKEIADVLQKLCYSKKRAEN